MIKKAILSSGLFKTIFAAIAISLIWANTANAGNGSSSFVPDELLVQSKAGVPEKNVKETIKRMGADIVDEIPQLRVKQIKVPAHALEKVKAALSKNPQISYVEHNYIAELTLLPNDSYYSYQWHLPKISAPQAWNISTGSDAVIAIIDTGIDPSHPDLASKLVPGYNFYNGNTDATDVHGHGTAVAGAAAAISNNSIGVAGVAWNNPVMPLRISDPSGTATYSAMASAITYAVDRGVKVINISFGGNSSSTTIQNAVNYAWNKGAIVFASAGNDASDALKYPAACNNAVAVSATTSSDALASFSNYGNWVDIAAPGASIYTTSKGGGYGYKSGTSFSSPIAAGLAALIISANPLLNNQQVVDIMKQNADDLGAPGFDPYFANGRINAYKSLVAATAINPQPDITPPVVSITSPAHGATVKGSVTISVSATDNVGVSRVDLYINNVLYASDITEPFNFYWNTLNELNGDYYLSAVAYDNAGNEGYSSSVTVYVSNINDTEPPVVSITSPVNGAYVSGTQKINVTASDNVGVTRIELYINGVLRSIVSGQNTLSHTWNTRKEAKGTHVITSKAYDSAGNVGTHSITVYK